MRSSPYDTAAGKRTVSVTVNGDLYAKAAEAGIDVSAVMERALAAALSRADIEKIKEEIREELAAYNAYIAEHGSPAEMAREHYAAEDDAV